MSVESFAGYEEAATAYQAVVDNQKAITDAQNAARASHENILSGHYEYPPRLGTG